jgi:hypothetical protein
MKMVIGDEMVIISCPRALIQKSKWQSKSRQNRPLKLLLGTVTGELMLTDRRWYRLTDLRPCDQVGKQYGHIV